MTHHSQLTTSDQSPYEPIDESFTALRGDRHLEKLHEGCRWVEGPVYVPAGRYLLWSDIPNDRMLRWDEPTGAVGVFRQPSDYSNGNTLDRIGRLVTCEHGKRRVTRTEHDGSITVIADSFRGKPLNSPNDVVIKSDDSIWFTDPSYGIDSDYEGHRAESEIGSCNVYRVDASGGECRIVADDFDRPNGLAFSPDESRLYITDSAADHIRVFDVADDGTPLGGEVFAICNAGTFDGLRVDECGRLWVGAGDGVHCFDPEGRLIGKVRLPEAVANVAWGGPKRNRLFICSTTSVYAIALKTSGSRIA